MTTKAAGDAVPGEKTTEIVTETNDDRFGVANIAAIMEQTDAEESADEGEELPDGEETPDGDETPDGEELPDGEETPDGDETPEEEEGAEREDKDPPEDEEDKLLKGLDAKTQASINKRIGKLVGREKEAIAARDAVQAEAVQLKEQVTVLQQKLASVDVNAVAKASGINPLLLTENAQDIEKREREIAAFEQWAIKHWDGYEGTGDEKDPSYSAEQIRSRYAELREEAAQILPQAKQMLAHRLQFNAAVKTVYPDLADPKSKDYQVAQRVFRQMPVFKTLPNAMLLIGDMLAGERLRAEKANKKKDPPPPPPRAPAAPKPGASPSIKPTPKKTGVNMKGLAARGFSADAVAEALD